MLGYGEALYASQTRLDELVGGTYLIPFSGRESGITNSGPSLLITLRRWYSTPLAVAPSSDDSNQLDSEESDLDLVRKTNLGQEALLCYHSKYQREDLEKSVRHFEFAWRNCPSTHRYYAVALVNLAKAKFISCQVDPTSASLEESIELYRRALDLRRPHPDRPATLLQLAQALLFLYEKQGYTETVADEIDKCLHEFRDFPEDTHERRAADLVLDTLKRCRVVNSGSLAELDELVQKLKDNARMNVDGYFDKPQRLINLSTTLWRRFEQCGKHSDLDESMAINEQALKLFPSRHPDRLPCLRTLSAMVWRLFEIHGDLDHIRKAIAIGEEALQLVPEGHSERPYWVATQILNAISQGCRNAWVTRTSKLRNMKKRLGSTFKLWCYDLS
ncbi:hypothetical protein L210DRAFT_2988797 [Boletus edulis BED1]|uniref:TPR-like protein n=1 Tax=Boletus edulis BED1 TaxID=1328754 RepID=A0AAD4BI66_BOLED|nr:hypothetical protein L210DRAFT_2988797 [Boletus edulis BED1]